MRHALTRHPDSICEAVASIDVDVERIAGRLRLRYVANGTIAGLLLPPPGPPERRDELWRTTCFEAFVGGADNAYTEFNFAPSTAWAAYRFTGYREGMANKDVRPPRIETRASPTAYALTAEFDLGTAAAFKLSLTAVIEETNGRKSYWALAHPPGNPGFHHIAGFTLANPKADPA